MVHSRDSPSYFLKCVFHSTFSCKSSVSSFYLWFVPPPTIVFCLIFFFHTYFSLQYLRNHRGSFTGIHNVTKIWHSVWHLIPMVHLYIYLCCGGYVTVFISLFICEQNNLKISGNVDNGPRKRWFNFITWIVKQFTLDLHPYCLDRPTTGVQA